LAGTSVLEEIQEVKNAFKHRSILESIFFIAGQELTEKDKNIYRKHHWTNRIVSFPGVASQLQKLLDHEDAKSMKVLKRLLEDIKICLPHTREWQGLEEIELAEIERKKKEQEKEKYREPTLFDVIV
jgi:D-serine dehydratase